MPKMVGIIPSNHIQMIDHIVPLCHLMQIPLCCMDRYTTSLIEQEYPPLPLFLSQGEELEVTLTPYEVLFYSHLHRLLPDSFLFGDYCLRKKAFSVCSLHGNSDKKWNQFWMERFIDEDIALFYGPHNREMLEQKGVLNRIKRFVEVGNYRALFYEEHCHFFEDKVPQWLINKKNRKAILYAPSWQASEVQLQDRRETSSFFSFADQLFHNLPEEYLLVFKPHPFLQRFFPEAIEEIKNKYVQKENIYFLEDYPLIYPLLSKIDIYLGDHSSIGYDFLYFDRPLVFFNHNGWDKEDRAIYLHRAGISISTDEFSSLFTRIEKEIERDSCRSTREELYRMTGSWIGGTGRFDEVKCAIGWSYWPMIIVGLFHNLLFAAVTHPVLFLALSLIGIALYIWSFMIFFQLIGEAHRFSSWRAVGAVAIAFVLVFVAMMIFSLLIPLLRPLFQWFHHFNN